MVTSTATEQLDPAVTAGNEDVPKALKLIKLVPGVAVSVGVAGGVPQLVVALAGTAMIIPGGKLSTKFIEITFASLAVLSIVKVSVLTPPRGMDAGAKPLLKPGLLVATVRSSVAEPLLPALDVRPLVVLVCVPGVLLVTLTEITQLPATPKRALLKEMVVPPSTASRIASAQSVKAFAGVAIFIPAGKASTNARSVTGFGSKFVIVKERVLPLPGPIVLGKKTLLKVGGVSTV